MDVYCGWMVAGGMDEEALNYLCYFLRRILSDQPLLYLDISKDEDIEDDSYLKLMRRKKTEMDYEADEWFHDYMLTPCPIQVMIAELTIC